MIEWHKITDEEMRKAVVSMLEREAEDMDRQAERNERDAKTVKFYKDRKRDEACAIYSRRQAAHFRQAIDLLKGAPMPAEEP